MLLFSGVIVVAFPRRLRTRHVGCRRADRLCGRATIRARAPPRPASRASRRSTVRADASGASETRRGPHDGLTRRQKRALSRPRVPTPSERRLAASLLAECSAGKPEPVDVAYVVCTVPREDGEGDRSIVWFAAAPASTPEWDTPVVRLVVGVREAAASASVNPHTWMRNRIFSTRPLGTLDRAFVKVAAGKATVLEPLVDHARLIEPPSSAIIIVANRRTTIETTTTSLATDARDAELDDLARYDAAHWARYAVRRGIRHARHAEPSPTPGGGGIDPMGSTGTRGPAAGTGIPGRGEGTRAIAGIFPATMVSLVPGAGRGRGRRWRRG